MKKDLSLIAQMCIFHPTKRINPLVETFVVTLFRLSKDELMNTDFIADEIIKSFVEKIAAHGLVRTSDDFARIRDEYEFYCPRVWCIAEGAGADYLFNDQQDSKIMKRIPELLKERIFFPHPSVGSFVYVDDDHDSELAKVSGKRDGGKVAINSMTFHLSNFKNGGPIWFVGHQTGSGTGSFPWSKTLHEAQNYLAEKFKDKSAVFHEPEKVL